MFKDSGSSVLVGTLGICATGIFVGMSWFTYVSGRKPKTLTPAWSAATAKYRASQNQDPITNQ